MPKSFQRATYYHRTSRCFGRSTQGRFLSCSLSFSLCQHPSISYAHHKIVHELEYRCDKSNKHSPLFNPTPAPSWHTCLYIHPRTDNISLPPRSLFPYHSSPILISRMVAMPALTSSRSILRRIGRPKVRTPNIQRNSKATGWRSLAILPKCYHRY